MYHIPKTKMLTDAKLSLSEKKPKAMGIEILIFFLVITVAQIPQALISMIYTMFLMFSDPAFWELMNAGTLDQTALNAYTSAFAEKLPQSFYALILASSGFMILAAILYCKIFEKRKANTLGFRKSGFLGEYAMGAVIGLIMLALPVLVCVLTGCVTLTISDSIDPLTILLFLLAFLLQGMGEEALFRGYLMTSLSRRTNIWTAILLNSLLFSVMHIANANFSFIPFLNIFLFGVFASVFMLKRGSIWAVGAIHSVWNFAQGNLFGFNVSGNPKFDTIFTSTQADFGAILHGGDFGPEGGLGVTVLLLVAILAALLLPVKKSEAAEEPEPEEAPLA